MLVAIYNQWWKSAKYLVVGYKNKTFVELMYCLYIRYGRITPGELMKSQDTISHCTTWRIQ